MIIDRIIIIKNLDKRQVELFSNYSAYQEWVMERTNLLKRPLLAWKFSQERSKEAQLENKYSLPQFSLRGVLYYISFETLKAILAKASAQQHSLARLIKTIKGVADPYPLEEPCPIKLPIRVTITTGDEVGSIYSFGDYDSYLNWKLARATLIEKVKLLKQDSKHRKLELLFEARYNKPANFYRGIFSTDYKHISLAYKIVYVGNNDRLLDRSRSTRSREIKLAPQRALSTAV